MMEQAFQKTGKKLFNKFYKADPTLTRERGENGSGLAIWRDISDNQFGKIWVKSESGQESTFTIPKDDSGCKTPL